MDEKNMEGGCGCKMCQKFGWCPAGKWCKILKVVLLLIILAFVCKFVFGNHDHYKNGSQQNTIVVNGKGEITVKPDMATVSFSVMAENIDVSKASDVVNTKISKIIDTLKNDGVAETDIKTSGYDISPRYDYVNSQAYPYNGKQVLVGYDVTQSIDLKIRDLSKASKIITDLSILNVTNMSGLSFTEDKYDDLVKQARDEAITQARADAQSLAKSLGVRLSKIVGYSEGQNPMPVFYNTMSAGVSAPSAREAVLPTGENKIISNVSITYEIQ